MCAVRTQQFVGSGTQNSITVAQTCLTKGKEFRCTPRVGREQILGYGALQSMVVVHPAFRTVLILQHALIPIRLPPREYFRKLHQQRATCNTHTRFFLLGVMVCLGSFRATWLFMSFLSTALAKFCSFFKRGPAGALACPEGCR